MLFVAGLKAGVTELTVAEGDANVNIHKPSHVASEAAARITITSLFSEVESTGRFVYLTLHVISVGEAVKMSQ